MSVADAYERYMLELINAERAKVGAGALQLELNLNESAEDHSLWMLDTDIFNHTGVNGSSSRDRMGDAGFDFSGGWGSGENIAVQTERGNSDIFDDVEMLHTSLMNSDGHRANILNPAFEFIGIGIELGNFNYGSGERESVIVTQNFAYSTRGVPDIDTGEPQSVETPLPDPEPEPDEPVATLNADVINAGAGDDTVRALRGNDQVFGEAGNDTLSGNDGSDLLNGGSGNDMLFGGRGNDNLNGAEDNDVLNGGQGNDIIYGAAGDDTLIGHSGADRLFGGNGADALRGGADADVLDGGQGNDDLTGGSGTDTFTFMRGGDVDTVLDFQDNIDTLDLSTFGFASLTDAMTLAGQVGGNVVFDFDRGDMLVVQNTQLSELWNDLLI